MRVRPRLRTVGVAISLAVVVSATAVASMPNQDGSGVRAISEDAALLPERVVPVSLAPIVAWDSLTRSEMLAARASHRDAVAALAAQKTRAVKKAAAKARKDRQNEGVVASGPIPTAATAKSREIQKLVKKHFPASQVGNAMAVAACESGHSDAIGAKNSDGTTDWGAFQLNDGGTLQGSLSAIGVSYNSIEHAQKLALNTQINVRAAAKIYQSRGWGPWVCAYKIGIVSSLYGNSAGPMDGKFDEMGKPTVDVPTVEVGPGPTKKRNEPTKNAGAKTGKKKSKATPSPTTSPDPADSAVAVPQPVVPQPVVPQPVAPQPVAPQPVTPDPSPSEPDPAPSPPEDETLADPNSEVLPNSTG